MGWGFPLGSWVRVPPGQGAGQVFPTRDPRKTHDHSVEKNSRDQY